MWLSLVLTHLHNAPGNSSPAEEAEEKEWKHLTQCHSGSLRKEPVRRDSGNPTARQWASQSRGSERRACATPSSRQGAPFPHRRSWPRPQEGSARRGCRTGTSAPWPPSSHPFPLRPISWIQVGECQRLLPDTAGRVIGSHFWTVPSMPPLQSASVRAK